jgi:hypothetical protein
VVSGAESLAGTVSGMRRSKTCLMLALAGLLCSCRTSPTQMPWVDPVKMEQLPPSCGVTLEQLKIYTGKVRVAIADGTYRSTNYDPARPFLYNVYTGTDGRRKVGIYVPLNIGVDPYRSLDCFQIDDPSGQIEFGPK